MTDAYKSCSVATLEELANFVEEEKLHGSGLSLVDLQLLYSAIVEDVQLWTFDRQLAKLARRYGVGAPKARWGTLILTVFMRARSRCYEFFQLNS